MPEKDATILSTDDLVSLFRKKFNLAADPGMQVIAAAFENLSTRIDEQDKILLLVAQRVGELMKAGKPAPTPPAPAQTAPAAAPAEDDVPPMAMPMAQKIKVNGVETPSATPNAKPATT